MKSLDGASLVLLSTPSEPRGRQDEHALGPIWRAHGRRAEPAAAHLRVQRAEDAPHKLADVRCALHAVGALSRVT